VIRALAQKSAWVTNHENIFVLGPTGVGKSFVACALALKACRDGCSALYTRATALFRDLASSERPALDYVPASPRQHSRSFEQFG
jgi:DNA replication protein DnaC